MLKNYNLKTPEQKINAHNNGTIAPISVNPGGYGSTVNINNNNHNVNDNDVDLRTA